MYIYTYVHVNISECVYEKQIIKIFWFTKSQLSFTSFCLLSVNKFVFSLSIYLFVTLDLIRFTFIFSYRTRPEDAFNRLQLVCDLLWTFSGCL